MTPSDVYSCHCGSKEFTPVFKNSVVRCRACGLARNYPLPYDSKSVESAYSHFNDKKMTEQFFEEKSETRKPYLEVVQKHFKSGTLLDIGAGSGIFSRLALEAGFEVSAIELNPEKAAWLSKNFKLKISRHIVEEAPFEKQSFDVVCAFAVLEHVLDPLKFLSCCRELIKPKGALVMSVPNLKGILSHHRLEWLTGISQKWFQADQHCWQFEPETLEKLLKEAGFKRVLLFPRPRYRHDMLKLRGINFPKVFLRKILFAYSETQNATPEMMAVGFAD